MEFDILFRVQGSGFRFQGSDNPYRPSFTHAKAPLQSASLHTTLGSVCARRGFSTGYITYVAHTGPCDNNSTGRSVRHTTFDIRDDDGRALRRAGGGARGVGECIGAYVYVYAMCTYVRMYVYTHSHRERETHITPKYTHIHLYISIYITYIYTRIHLYRDICDLARNDHESVVHEAEADERNGGTGGQQQQLVLRGCPRRRPLRIDIVLQLFPVCVCEREREIKICLYGASIETSLEAYRARPHGR